MHEITTDQTQRQRALATNTSFIVQAPAGSGKTELLTQRFLALLAEVEKAPEEIIAITFTRKAAAEMQARILAALRKAQEEEKPKALHALQTWQLAQKVLARDAACQWQLLDNPNRLRIQTIDSLCASLVRRMPLLAHFGATPHIIENAYELYQRAIRAILQNLDSDTEWASPLQALLLHLDNDYNKVEQLLLNMLARREQWLAHILGCNARETLESALQHIIIAAMQKVHDLFPFELTIELVTLVNYAAGNLGKPTSQSLASFPDKKIEHLVYWQQIINLLLTKEGSWRKKVDVRLGFPPASATANAVEKQQFTDMKQRMEVLLAKLAEYGALQSALTELATAPPPNYDEQQWVMVDALVKLLPVLVASLQLEFQERGQVDHAEMMLKALQSLGTIDAPTDLAFILDYQVRHLLIDEFQDTSASQFRLLQLLTVNWNNHCGRTLFLVGDPMQSIYRFRKAEVGIFLRAWNEGVGHIKLESLLLTSNFRSEASIVKWINQHFKTLLPAKDDITSSAVAYQLATAMNQIEKEDAVQIHSLIDADNEIEARTIVEIVKTTQAQNPDASIAILVMARTHLATIIPALQQENIAFRAVEIENLFQRMVIQDLYALTCALLHPADRIAWLSILRAPWCGLTLTELHSIVHSPDPLRPFTTTIWEQLQKLDTNHFSPITLERLNRFINIIKTALKQRQRSPLRAWIESVWLALGGPACVSHVADLANAQAFFNLLEQYDRGGIITDMSVFATQLQNLTAQTHQDTTTKLDIMTIHKAKGLEFDCVILPGLQRAARRDEQQLLLWGEQQLSTGENDLIIAPIKATGTQTDAIYDYLRRLESKKAYHEAGRLLYVAATRAKRNLHLIAQAQTDEKNPDMLKKPSNGSLLEQLWPQVADVFKLAKERPSPHSSSIHTRKQETSSTLKRLKNTWVNPLLIASPNIETKHVVAATTGTQSEILVQDAASTAQIIGIVAHYFLRYLSQHDIKLRTPNWIMSQQTLIQHMLMQQHLAETDLALGIATVNTVLQNSLQDKQGCWILDHTHEDAHSEFPITAMLDNQLVHLVIDRTFVFQNTRWIIDYKVTDFKGPDQQEFLAEQTQLYQAQLFQYARAMQLLDTRPIRLGLYFPLLPAWREISNSR